MLVMSEEPGRLERYFSGYFDKILIDAPCSGEGMFRKDIFLEAAEKHYHPGSKNVKAGWHDAVFNLYV